MRFFPYLLSLFCCCFLFSSRNFGQLVVEAGNDTIVCTGYNYDQNEQIRIGGLPTATGGVEPYTYTWSGARKLAPLSKHIIYASDILDDTTKCNPSFNRAKVPEDWFTLHLEVEDDVGHIGYDSVRINASGFVYNLIAARYATINRGDSVPLLGNLYIDGSFRPFTFTISPSFGLTITDSTNLDGWVKPDTTTRYYLQAVNSIGCISKQVPYLVVDVDTTTATRDIINNAAIQCFFDHGDLVINLLRGKSGYFQVTLAATNGILIHTGNYTNRNLRITNLKLIENQIYVVTIVDGNVKKSFKLPNY